MNILFATPSPPIRTKPRPHYFIRELARRGHAVHVLTQVSGEEERESLADTPGWKEVVTCCASMTAVAAPTSAAYLRCVRSLPTRTPLRVAYCEAPSYINKVRDLGANMPIDVVHVDRERLARVFRTCPQPKVLDATDSISLYNKRLERYSSGIGRMIAVVEAARMKRFEMHMAAGYAACLMSAERDASMFQALGADVSVRVIPNGVEERFLQAGRHEVEANLVFVGNMSYPPNVDAVRWFVRAILPTLRSEIPAVTFTIVGVRPDRKVRALASVPGVVVTGGVSDVMPFLQRASAFVSPMRIGGGFPNKVAEAMAAGVPVVSTPAGCEGIDGIAGGHDLLVASTDREFAYQTVQLLGDRALRERMGAAGHTFICSRHSWASAAAQLELEYQRAIADVDVG